MFILCVLDAHCPILSIERKLEEAGYAAELADMDNYTAAHFRKRKDVDQPTALTDRSECGILAST